MTKERELLQRLVESQLDYYGWEGKQYWVCKVCIPSSSDKHHKDCPVGEAQALLAGEDGKQDECNGDGRGNIVVSGSSVGSSVRVEPCPGCRNCRSGRNLTAENARLKEQAEYYRRANEEMRPNLDRACAERDAYRVALRDLVHDLNCLITDSEGVAGLHFNGNVAPWETLEEGGEFEEWLIALARGKRALST